MNAIEFLITGDRGVDDGSWLSASMNMSRYLVAAVALIALGLATARYLGRTPLHAAGLRFPRTGAEWRATLTVSTVYFVVLVLGNALSAAPNLMAGAPVQSYPVAGNSVPYIVDESFSSVLAGPTEELVLAAVIPVLLCAARIPFGWVVVICAVMRASFHIYYGLSTIPGHLAWGAAAILVWRVWPSAWGLAIAHTVSNALNTPSLFDPEGPLSYVAALAMLLLISTGFWMAVQHFWPAALELHRSGRVRNYHLNVRRRIDRTTREAARTH